MDYQIRWSPEAVEDIEEITAYIHKDSPLYAQKVVEELISEHVNKGGLALSAAHQRLLDHAPFLRRLELT